MHSNCANVKCDSSCGAAIDESVNRDRVWRFAIHVLFFCWHFAMFFFFFVMVRK